MIGPVVEPHVFVLALLAGGLVLAGWLFVHFPRTSAEAKDAALHSILAFAAVQCAALFTGLAADLGGPKAAIAASLVVVLGAFVYTGFAIAILAVWIAPHLRGRR